MIFLTFLRPVRTGLIIRRGSFLNWPNLVKYSTENSNNIKSEKVSPTIQKFFQKSYKFTRDAFYLGIVVGALTVCGTVLFTIGKELWLENSLKNLVDKSNLKISSDPYVENKLGSPLRFEYGSSARIPAGMISIDEETNLEKMSCQYVVY